MPAFIQKIRDSGSLGLLILCSVSVLLFLAAVTAVLLIPKPKETPPAPEFILMPEVSAPQLPVTMEQISQLSYTDSRLGELHWELSASSLLELNRVLLAYGITSPEEICQFLAQATIETGAGLSLTESADESYCLSHGYTIGTRGAGYLHLTHEYGQMAFATWMMKRNVPELADAEFANPANSDSPTVAAAYHAALQSAANLGLDVSRYSRIVYDPGSPVTTGADHIADCFAWESAAYYWTTSGIREALTDTVGLDGVDAVTQIIGGTNRQSRREAYAAFAPVLIGLDTVLP